MPPRLRLADATAMAVGGMVGGGVFSVVGVAVDHAGHAALGCFVIGGALAALTARSWASVTARSAPHGGLVAKDAAGRAVIGGTLVWIVLFGYMAAIAVYAFTFGHYAASAMHGSSDVARLLSAVVVAVFYLVNRRGLRVSSRTQDVVVLAALVLAAGIAILGAPSLSTQRLTPITNDGVGGLLLGSVIVFFAYEGFELLCYERGELHDPNRVLPRALYLSIGVTALFYVVCTVGAQMLVSDHVLVAHRDAAFIEVGHEALGAAGRWIVVVAALLATGSAINATLFFVSRLARDASRAGELPSSIGASRRDVPVRALSVLAAGGIALAMLSNIDAVLAVGSTTFILVFTVVNAYEARTAPGWSARVLASIAATASVAAFVVLVVDLARHDVGTLVLVAAVPLVVVALRWLRQPRAARG